MQRIASLLALAALAAGPALSQQSGLVNVSLNNVANNIAQNLSVDVSQIPVSVQAPIGVAANVCGIDANVLAQQAQGGAANCAATTTSNALNQIVLRQIR